MKNNNFILYGLLIFIINCSSNPEDYKNGAHSFDGKSKIKLKDSFLYIDNYRLPVLIKYDKYKMDTIGWCDGGEIECLRFRFIDSTKKLEDWIEYEKFKTDNMSPSGFLDRSDLTNLYIDSSYKRVIYKAFLLNRTFKYLFTFYGPDFSSSEYKYYNYKHYFKLIYNSEIKDSVKTNRLMEKVFNSDFKLK